MIPFLLLTLFSLLLVFAGWKKKYGLENDLRRIDAMDGISFEHFIAKLLQKRGFTLISDTRISGDFGADLILSYRGESYAVQCKRNAKNVGIKAVQEVVASKAHYGCDRAMVVTNSRYTNAAKQLAIDNKVILWDRDHLIEELNYQRFQRGGNL